MKLIVGLGNPGQEYLKTRHNVGFLVVDQIARQLLSDWQRDRKHNSGKAESRVGSEKVIMVKPQTFMNLAGASVKQYLEYYKLEPKDIWVVSDDLDLPLGKVRVRDSGSSGGHNGLKSISESIGSEDYYRIRVGIGPIVGSIEVVDTSYDAARYVLETFTLREQPILDDVIALVADLVLVALQENRLDSHTITVDAIL